MKPVSPRLLGGYAAAIGGVVAVTAVFKLFIPGVNNTTVALSLLLVVLAVASTSGLRASILASISGVLCFNYFFLPPVGSFTIEDPQNWVALSAFLLTAFIASKLSSSARTRAYEAERRREEVWKLYQLSRAIIVTPDTGTATSTAVKEIVDIFGIDYCGIFLPDEKGKWARLAASSRIGEVAPPDSLIASVYDAATSRVVRSQEVTGLNGPNAKKSAGEYSMSYVPLKVGVKPIGVAVLASASQLDPATNDAIGGLIALALERARFLKEVSRTEALKQSDALKSALLASVSHGLRTPLTSIRTAIGSILHQDLGLDKNTLGELHQIIGEEVERLTRLVDNLLEMARIDAGELPISREWESVAEVFGNVLERCSACTRDHVVRVEQDDGGTLVKIDTLLLAEALANLVENAAKYSKPGSEIVIRSELPGNNLILSVADQGPGIDPDEASRLFDKFYRGSQTVRGSKTGTGMGLAIARGIVEAHGGAVWVRPGSQGGAVFGFTIPVEVKQALETAPAGPGVALGNPRGI